MGVLWSSSGVPDPGFRFRSDCWGQGYATESSRAIVRHGFEVLRLKRILGLVLPENGASIRVLEKVGMRYEGVDEFMGDHVQRWAIEH